MTAGLSNKQQSKLLNAAISELESVGAAQQAQNAANTEIAQQVVEQLKVLNGNIERLITRLAK